MGPTSESSHPIGFVYIIIISISKITRKKLLCVRGVPQPKPLMEAIAYPQTPLFSFSTEHDESISDDPVGCTDPTVHTYLGEEHPHANWLFQGPVLSLEENLVAIQEELMEENSSSDLLLAAADAVESADSDRARSVLDRLDRLLLAQSGSTGSFDRLAHYFARGLRSRTAHHGPRNESKLGRSDSAHNMSAHQMVQELSPYVKFAHFTANQAILEATDGDDDVHVIDFDVMEGIQWPPLMADLVGRGPASSLRITAVVKDGDAVDSVHRTGRRLSEFAESIGLMLHFDWISMNDGGDLERIELNSKRTLIVSCMMHQVQCPSRSYRSLKSFLLGVKKLSPRLVVLVEDELFRCSKSAFDSFSGFFCEALHHFSTTADSLGSSFCGGYKMGLRIVERDMLGPKIEDCVGRVEYGPGEKWVLGEGLHGFEGFRPIPVSGCNVSQAKFLVGLFNRGYGVKHEMGRLALCWKSRPLTTVSVWVPA